MATRIPYLDETWSPVTGCGDDMASPGCLNCYARRMFGRNLWKCERCTGLGDVTEVRDRAGIHEVYDGVCPTCHGTGHADFTPAFHADRLEQPLHWRKPRRIGVSFMGDLFHEAISYEQITRVLLTTIQAYKHTYLILTKRPDRMRAVITHWREVGNYDMPNVHLGVTVCNQAEADRNIPLLLDTPAAVRWVSYEPAIGSLSLFGHDAYVLNQALDWLVVGGETGPGARPMQPEWTLDVYRQCKAAGVAFWFKQWGREHPFHIPGPELYTQTEYVEMLEMEATHELPAALAEAVAP